MSGYLAAIAARVGGGRAMVQPRPLARFEGEAASADTAPELAVEEPARATTQPTTPASPRRAEPVRPAPAVPPAQPGRERAAVLPERAVAPRAMQVPPFDDAHPLPRPASPMPAVAPAVPPQPLSRRGEEPQPAGRRQQAVGEDIAASSHPATALLPDADAPAQPRQPEPPAAQPAPEQPPPIRLRLAAPQRHPAAAPRPEAAPMAQAPISVTIGRVEIRATVRAPQSPAPGRPAAPSSPGELSLDAYLRRRDGGSG